MERSVLSIFAGPIRLLPVAALLFFCAACTMFVKEPEVKLQRLNVIGVDTKGADLELFLNVNNPNSFSVAMTGYSYDLQVMALPVAKGGSRNKVEFRGKTDTDIRLPVRVEYGTLWEILKRRPDPDKVPYHLQAGFELDTPVGEMLVPLDRKETFSIPKEYRPSFYLQQLKGLLN
jgi:LEA14-like dessication related protein